MPITTNTNTKEKIKRLDLSGELRDRALSLCRLKPGQIWTDEVNGHKVAVLDAAKKEDIKKLFGEQKTALLINDPPYNVIVGNANTQNLSRVSVTDYIEFSKRWVDNAVEVMLADSHLYIWLGADIKDAFQPLPEFMIMMRQFDRLNSRNFITMRNQRGYGTQKNWMHVRQELLHYTKGDPNFTVVYTDIPKILKGYYKTVNGKKTENLERGKSDCIRPGNVWVDIQQVFYRMHENVPGCYAQKPLKAIERIIGSSSKKGDLIADFFAHSGTTLIAAEKTSRTCYTIDNDPIFVELTIRRLENFRKTGKPGFQWNTPFPELDRQ